MKPLLEAELRKASLTFPKLSVIIINFNDGTLLENCLNSLLETDYPSFEVILFDNNSHDGSLQNTAAVFRGNEKVSIIISKQNMGFSAANEIASKVATGEYLIFLNNDTVVDKKWLLEILRVFEEESVGICQSKLVSLTNKRSWIARGIFLPNTGFHLSVDITSRIYGISPMRFFQLEAQHCASSANSLSKLEGWTRISLLAGKM